MFFFFPPDIDEGESVFENIKHFNDYGQEFWYARELQNALEYTEWRNFSKAISKAIEACAKSGNNVNDHFVEINKTIPMPKGAHKEIQDYQSFHDMPAI